MTVIVLLSSFLFVAALSLLISKIQKDKNKPIWDRNKTYIENYCINVLHPVSSNDNWRRATVSVYRCSDLEGKTVYMRTSSWGLNGDTDYVDESGKTLCKRTWTDLPDPEEDKKCLNYVCEQRAICKTPTTH